MHFTISWLRKKKAQPGEEAASPAACAIGPLSSAFMVKNAFIKIGFGLGPDLTMGPDLTIIGS
jgi:hypothetical protein